MTVPLLGERAELLRKQPNRSDEDLRRVCHLLAVASNTASLLHLMDLSEADFAFFSPHIPELLNYARDRGEASGLLLEGLGRRRVDIAEVLVAWARRNIVTTRDFDLLASAIEQNRAMLEARGAELDELMGALPQGGVERVNARREEIRLGKRSEELP